MSELNYRNKVDEFVNQQDEILSLEIQAKECIGSIYIEIASIDCDLYERTTLALIPANLKDYKQFEDLLYEEQEEGSFSMVILTKEQGDNWKQRTSDHRAEQYNY